MRTLFGINVDMDVVGINNKVGPNLIPKQHQCEFLGCKEKATLEAEGYPAVLFLCAKHAAIAALTSDEKLRIRKPKEKIS